MHYGRRKKYETSEDRNRPIERFCDVEGCVGEGAYRAPKSRDPSEGYHMFCLEHVREYNKGWNFFAGMSDSEVDAFQRSAPWAHRPTWRMGDHRTRSFQDGSFSDPFGFAESAESAEERQRRQERRFTADQKRAFGVLQLEPTDDLREIKLRYKQLAKRFHPDANGGDRGFEDRLKRINEAYGVLSASLG
ncbi:MAG: J domain-containing protein [Minwuia sp.]|uniref:J domain-containing protein n=1 Tax=Minwuia sp. TaxID=2493630 RepID=UPI003A891C1F